MNRLMTLTGVTAAALLWGTGQSYAQTYVPPPQLVPGIDYGKANYGFSPVLRKFVNELPGVTLSGAAVPGGGYYSKVNALGQCIPIAIPTAWPEANGTSSDYYEIAIVDYFEQMHSDMLPTKLRGYVQIEPPGAAQPAGSLHVALTYTDAAKTPITFNGKTVYAYDKPHYLGPLIVATSGKATRIKFYNLLATTAAGGDLFIPTDTTLMGGGQGPLGPSAGNYTQNRAVVHLHGGDTPWISDGTPHQWITPAGETSPYTHGASEQSVPDMGVSPAGTTTLYYPNGQSGRLLFYHEHAQAITRLGVYAGTAAGFLIRDPSEQALDSFAPGGEIPLIIQDKGYVSDGIPPTGFTGTPQPATSVSDPTWALNAHWGQSKGSLWFPHVYMPNQNPNDLSGANPFGRWDYGQWFWPIFPVVGKLPQTATAPLPSVVPESFLDTPVINGTAYPTLTVQPTTYRFRVLSVGNERYFNLQFYVADPTITTGPGVGTEVRMIPAVKGPANALGQFLAAGALDGPATVWPPTWTANDTPGMTPNVLDNRVGGVPDPSPSLQGPVFVHIGSDGGLSPQATVMPNTPIGYEQNKRSVTVLNTYEHTLFLGPAERADVLVDFSQFAGKTLIMYNDAPAPLPAGDPRNDYYTGDVDNTSQGGAPSTSAGFGPNTRTIMQIKVAPAPVPVGGAAIQSITLTAPGSGYTAPLVNISDTAPGKGSGATATATVSGGYLTAISFAAPNYDGQGYITPVVNIDAPPVGGTQATATAALDKFNHIASVTILNPGSGYTTAPNVTITDANTALVPGRDYWPANVMATIVPAGTITGITLTAGGTGYSAPVVTITDTAPGTGSGAMATANLNTPALPGLDVASLNTAVAAAFKASQPKPVVPETGYATAEGAPPSGTDVYALISDTSLTFSPYLGAPEYNNGSPVTVPLQPKTIQELFDPLGRMNATLGVEVPFTTATVQTTLPMGFEDPATEVIPNGSYQLWKITHNGVDTHALHFHLWNLQVINRVGWDGAIKPPWPEELGWKDTVKMNPLEDIIVALRAKVPTLPFGIPNSIRPLSPSNPLGAITNYYGAPIFLGVDPSGNPVTVSNIMANFGNEYVWHCHLLGHEENDMMRPVCVASAPKPPTGFTIVASGGNAVLTWVDTTPDETGFIVEKKVGTGPWTTLATVPAGTLTYTDTAYKKNQAPQYQVIAVNTVGSGVPGYPSVTMSSLPVTGSVASAPIGQTVISSLTQAPAVGSPVVVNWTYSATDQTGFTVQRSTNSNFPVNNTTTFAVAGNVFTQSSTITGLKKSTTYYYRVTPTNAAGSGGPSATVSILVHP